MKISISNVTVFDDKNENPVTELKIGQRVIINSLVGLCWATITKIRETEAEADSGGSTYILSKQEDGSWWCQLGYNKSIIGVDFV